MDAGRRDQHNAAMSCSGLTKGKLDLSRRRSSSKIVQMCTGSHRGATVDRPGIGGSGFKFRDCSSHRKVVSMQVFTEEQLQAMEPAADGVSAGGSGFNFRNCD